MTKHDAERMKRRIEQEHDRLSVVCVRAFARCVPTGHHWEVVVRIDGKGEDYAVRGERQFESFLHDHFGVQTQAQRDAARNDEGKDYSGHFELRKEASRW